MIGSSTKVKNTEPAENVQNRKLETAVKTSEIKKAGFLANGNEGLLFRLWRVYDNFLQNILILSLWNNNSTFSTWQQSLRCVNSRVWFEPHSETHC